MTSEVVLDVLLTAEQIQQRVEELAGEIQRDHPEGVHLVAVLNGAFMFLSDLIRYMDGSITLDFVAVSSYGAGTESSGRPRLLKDIESPIAGRDVVIVEDIVDGGLTVSALTSMLASRQPRALRTACLLDKPSRRRVAIRPDYVGFSIGDHFVVGYGLDQGGKFRNLPYIAVIK